MRENLTYIGVVLDKSSSMASLADETITGFNTFLKEQKEAPGEAILTLAQFSSDYQLIHNGISLKDVPELNRDTYRPSGWTALLDAIGRTMNSMGSKLSAMKEEDRPSKVILLIMTDGEENQSKEFNHDQIMKMIDHQQTKYNWSLVFIGAGKEAIAQGTNLGFKKASTYSYSNDRRGTGVLYSSVSSGISDYRSAPVGAAFNMADPLEASKNLSFDPTQAVPSIISTDSASSVK